MKNNKLDNIKKWTISTYKCSRQSLYEKLGKTSRTVDPELDEQIETLRDTQRKYSNILRLAKTLSGHFFNMVQTQVCSITYNKDQMGNTSSTFYLRRTPLENVSLTSHTNLQSFSRSFSTTLNVRGISRRTVSNFSPLLTSL